MLENNNNNNFLQKTLPLAVQVKIISDPITALTSEVDVDTTTALTEDYIVII